MRIIHFMIKLKLFLSLFFLAGCYQNSNLIRENQRHQKINGIIFDGPARPPINDSMFTSLQKTGTNWIATTPEAYTYRNTLGVKSFFQKGQWYGESIHGAITVINIAKKRGYKVMLKPHIGFSYDVSNWQGPEKINVEEKDSIINTIIRNSKELNAISDPNEFRKRVRNHKDLKPHYDEIENHFKAQNNYISKQENLTLGNWRGDFEVADSTHWSKWENGYEQFILKCAKMADSLKVDLFCLGTELGTSAVKREDFWRQLIRKVRTIYTGPVTYSANWDNFQHITFWNELDYIGISAYFPVSNKGVPDPSDIRQGWKEHRQKIEVLSKKYSIPILFTEYGYKSIEFAGEKPWQEYVKNEANELAQYNLYQGLYKSFWKKDWFAGGFIWKWYHSGNGGERSFSPQGKKAEKAMTEWYSKDHQ